MHPYIIATITTLFLTTTHAFTHPLVPSSRINNSSTKLHSMQRPILDRLASLLFRLETDRVSSSSILDDKGRNGEPMEWAKEDSIANQFSIWISSNEVGYRFKQTVADLIAGDYDQDSTQTLIREFIASNPVAIFSFSTCPFCRTAKDYLDEASIPYSSMELDLLPTENRGNEIRAQLGKLTKRTSVPSIFIGGEYIGGCNDGNPGLIPLSRMEGGMVLNDMLVAAGVER